MNNVAGSRRTPWFVAFVVFCMLGFLLAAWLGGNPEKLRLAEIEKKRAAILIRLQYITENLKANKESPVANPIFPTTADEFIARAKDPKLLADTYTEFLPVPEHQKLMRYILEQHPVESLNHRLAYEDDEVRRTQHGKKHQYSLRAMSRVLHDEWNAEYRREELDVPPGYRMEYPIEHSNKITLSLSEQALRELHRNKEDAFALQASYFGMDRMPPISVHWVYPSEYESPVVQLPEVIEKPHPEVSNYSYRPMDKWEKASAKIDAERKADVRKAFAKFFHKAATFRFGYHSHYVPEFRQAVRFRNHTIDSMKSWSVFQSYYSPRNPEWILTRLELVSMLKFDSYRVYVSENLPNMKNLQEAGTRPLDEFESKSIDSLFKGETIVAQETEDSLRAVGAIRASTKCLECHSVRTGEMLGAFTYQFKRNETVSSK